MGVGVGGWGESSDSAWSASFLGQRVRSLWDMQIARLERVKRMMFRDFCCVCFVCVFARFTEKRCIVQ